MHAQPGALAVQMLAVGVTAEGSSSVPGRTTVIPGRPDESEKTCVPHWPQKRRVTSFPLSAVLVCQASSPVTSMASLGKTALTVPLAASFWQSRHQQMREAPGSARMRK